MMLCISYFLAEQKRDNQQDESGLHEHQSPKRYPGCYAMRVIENSEQKYMDVDPIWMIHRLVDSERGEQRQEYIGMLLQVFREQRVEEIVLEELQQNGGGMLLYNWVDCGDGRQCLHGRAGGVFLSIYTIIVRQSAMSLLSLCH